MRSITAPLPPATQQGCWVVPLLESSFAVGDAVTLRVKGASWGHFRVKRVVHKSASDISYHDLSGFLDPSPTSLCTRLSLFYKKPVDPETNITFLHLDTDWADRYSDDSEATFERSSTKRSRFRVHPD